MAAQVAVADCTTNADAVASVFPASAAVSSDLGGPALVARDAHMRFIKALNEPSHASSFEGVVTQHLRMSGVYWGLSALWILGAQTLLPLHDIVQFVHACAVRTRVRARAGAADEVQADALGFGGNVGHDANLLYTLSAVQLLAMCDALASVDADAVAAFVSSLQSADGSFRVSHFGETDTRATYCALATLALLRRLHAVDVHGAVAFLMRCSNLDGGFGAVPGGESHAGQVFTCVAALAIADGYLRDAHAAGAHASGRWPLDALDAELLGWWLCERQSDGGGLNGRPEKQADVCYSWWILSALAIAGRVHWINARKLAGFIRAAQDEEGGGIADRPGNMTDVFHTFFGLAGLSLLGELDAQPWHARIDPVYALPVELVRRLRLPATVLVPALRGPAAPTQLPGV